MLWRDELGTGEDQGTGQRILELADVARPAIRREQVERLAGDPVHGESPTREQRERGRADVLRSFAERGDGDREHREPVV